MDVHLVFSPVWSWPLVVLAAVGLYGLVLWTYPPRIRAFSPGKRRLLLGLRLLGATVLLFAMLRPALEFSEIDERGAQIVILTDQSRSMNTPDGPAGATRRQQLLKTLEEITPALKALGEKVDIRYIEFAETSQAVEIVGPASEGRFTALGLAIDEIRKEDQAKRLAAVFMLSDGAQRASGEANVDPRAAARRFATQKSVPIYTIPFGTSEITTAGMDLAVEDLLVNATTFERKIETVKAKVRMVGSAGRKVRVRLMVEDRSGKAIGQPGEWQEFPYSEQTKTSLFLETNENATLLPVTLSFIAALPGEYKLALEVEPQPGEVKTTNNRLETLITVTKGGMRVAYFDVASHVEQKFIRNLNKTARIQLDTFFVSPNSSRRPSEIDPKLFETGRYDVYVLGDVPASAFSRNGVNLLDELAKRVSEGSGLCLLGGQHNYSAGGYGATRLGELFPVKLTANTLPAGQLDPTQHLKKKIQILPTPDGESHFLMVLDPNANEQAWRSLPPMNGANKLVPRNGAVGILAESAEGDPLLLATDVGRSRVAALAFDETWLWHLNGRGEAHQKFWQQMLLWLAHKEQDGDQPLWVKVDPRNFAPGAKVPIQMGLRDEKKQPVENAEYQVEIIGPDGQKLSATPQKQPGGASADFTETTLPGDYWVSVRAKVGGKSVGLPTITRFIVEARDIELDNPAADPDLLAEIAVLTGGSVVPPEKLGTFMDDLLKSGISTELTRNRMVNLWDNWPLLLVFASVMTLEWFVRKKNGLV